MGTECTVVGIPIYELSETASRAQISVTVEVRREFIMQYATSQFI